ncbi:30S ribosomal protein S19e [Candidatus Woesearchaeota archaeon]|nr:30S ribosomal protein S19e [Candidatus Woesearchaeota archaeon]
MAIIYDIDATELVEEAAKELQKIEAIKPPAWALFIKTGHSKERPPARNDWWYVRAAAVLRKVYRFGPIGVSKLRGMYGSKKNRGAKAEHFYKGSGNVIRKILQQLEKAEFLRQGKIGIHKGRIITPKGKKFLDKIATKLKGPKKEVKAEEKPKPEAKPKAKQAPKAEAKPATEVKETKEKHKEEKPKQEAKPKPAEEEKTEQKEGPEKEEAKPEEAK